MPVLLMKMGCYFKDRLASSWSKRFLENIFFRSIFLHNEEFDRIKEVFKGTRHVDLDTGHDNQSAAITSEIDTDTIGKHIRSDLMHQSRE